jgi:putative redox protein
MARTTSAALTWRRELEFDATSGRQQVVLDSDGKAGLSPVEALALALLGCMSIDVVDIVRKGRHPLSAFRAELLAERAEDPPRRFTRVALHFVVTGDVPGAAVERAIALSRDTYCSVWQSLRQDIDLVTTFEVQP